MADDFVTLTTYVNPKDAELARTRLEAKGIRALIVDHESAGKSWHLAETAGGVKLMVCVDDEDRAEAILEEYVRESHRPPVVDEPQSAAAEDECVEPTADDAETPESDPEPTDAPTARELNAERAYKSQVFAFVFFPLVLMALAFIVMVAMSRERLEGRYRRQYRVAVGLHFAFLAVGSIVVLLISAVK